MSIQAANIQPLKLKSLAHQQTMLNNLVCGQRPQLQGQIHGLPCIASLQPMVEVLQFDMELQLEIDGLPARMQVTKELFGSVTMGKTPPLSEMITQLPDDLRLGCAQVALEQLLTNLGTALQRDIQLKRMTRCEQISAETPCLGLKFRCHNPDGSESTAHGALIASDLIHSLLKSHLKDNSGTAMTTSVDHIAIPLTLEVGHTVIADTRLQQVASGDIVLMDRCWYRNDQSVLLRISDTEGYLGTLDGSRITLRQRIKQGLESGMSNDFDDFDDLDDDFDLGDDFEDLNLDDPLQANSVEPEASAAEPESAFEPDTPQPAASQPAQQVSHKDVQGLPVKLTFDIGQQELTVGDMGHLGPGYSFEMNRDLTSPVTMKANGKPFAECELVSINNRLGARIVRLL